MPLLTDFVNKPVAKTLTYDLLKGHLKNLPKKKRDAIQVQVNGLEGKLKHVQMTIPPGTNAATLVALSSTAGVNIVTAGVGAASPDKVQNFRVLLALFDDAPPNTPVITVFNQNKPDGTYPYLSAPFVTKHFAKNMDMARMLATQRYNGNNAIVVSSFLTPSSTQGLSDEIKTWNDCGLFKGLARWMKDKKDVWLGKNKKIRDLVFRSKNRAQKWQCTQANLFVPLATLDHVYYATCQPEGSARHIADHYVRRAEVISETGKVTGGYEEIKLADLASHFSSAQVNFQTVANAAVDEDDVKDGLRIYVRMEDVV